MFRVLFRPLGRREGERNAPRRRTKTTRPLSGVNEPPSAVTRFSVVITLSVICLPVLLVFSGASASLTIGILAAQAVLVGAIRRFQQTPKARCEACDARDEPLAKAEIAEDHKEVQQPDLAALAKIARQLSADDVDGVERLLELLNKIEI